MTLCFYIYFQTVVLGPSQVCVFTGMEAPVACTGQAVWHRGVESRDVRILYTETERFVLF